MTFPLAIVAFDEEYTGNVYKTVSPSPVTQ